MFFLDLSLPVHFGSLCAEGESVSLSGAEIKALAEKAKWARRRERKERRDSERRGSFTMSDSDEELGK